MIHAAHRLLFNHRPQRFFSISSICTLPLSCSSSSCISLAPIQRDDLARNDRGEPRESRNQCSIINVAAARPHIHRARNISRALPSGELIIRPFFLPLRPRARVSLLLAALVLHLAPAGAADPRDRSGARAHRAITYEKEENLRGSPL